MNTPNSMEIHDVPQTFNHEGYTSKSAAAISTVTGTSDCPSQPLNLAQERSGWHSTRTGIYG